MRTGRSLHISGGFGGFWSLCRSLLVLPLLLSACQTTGQGTLAELRNRKIDIRESRIENVPEKAMESYRHFLAETPKSALRPEAIRRLADLKVERESGLLSGDSAPEPGKASDELTAPEPAARPVDKPTRSAVPVPALNGAKESQDAFEKRAVQTPPPAPARAPEPTAEGGPVPVPEGTDAREAIRLYTKLLNDYPDYDRSDEVLYQMSRAYEELGQLDQSMQVLDRLAREHPGSRYVDEVQFRRGEYFFTRRRYPDAESAYRSVVTMGASSPYYPLALYKLGWSQYKQEHYEQALDSFIALLDHKVATGVDIAHPADESERKRLDDTFRVISLSFSNLGGTSSVFDYFDRKGERSYEDSIFSGLAEFYFDKHRYSDAAAVYNSFIQHYPFHRVSPQFQMRVIEIHLAGGFPSLVIEAKKEFASRYGVKSDYWKHFDPAARPEVLGWLKTNLADLAKHYHALYQSPKRVKDKAANFDEAVHWYHEYIDSFPKAPDAAAMNYLLADLYLENRDFERAAREYEKTAYDYPRHAKSSQAGYAAVYAWRQLVAAAGPDERDRARKETVRSSITFAGSFPEHEKAPVVLGAAADDLYDMKDYELAVAAARSLIIRFPKANRDVLCQAWLVNGHASYELHQYQEAEGAYATLLKMLPKGDKRREGLTDNLAAAIYKQGEEARSKGNYLAAAAHFLRVGTAAPDSKIRPTAEYDGAASLIEVKDWITAATVLKRFRTLYPGHQLQPEVTRKLAYVYREMGEYGPAADEYERVERESTDEKVQREALLSAAEMHQKAGHEDRELAVYQRYTDLFPHPVETNLDLRDRMAEILKKKPDQEAYLAELQQIVTIDAAAGDERTPRTRSLAAKAALVLAQQSFDRFAAVKLVEPFQANLDKKKELMKAATQQFNGLVDYEIGDITAAATYYLAEIYADFSKDLKESERPAGLNDMEKEEYELAIEDQAYPFEEKAIATHQSNLELISRGVYDQWIEKSLQKLAVLMPARYDKPELESPVITSPDSFVYALGRPVAEAAEPQQPAQPGKAAADEGMTSGGTGTAEAPAAAQEAKDGEKTGQAETPAAAETAAPVSGPSTTAAGTEGTAAP